MMNEIEIMDDFCQNLLHPQKKKIEIPLAELKSKIASTIKKYDWRINIDQIAYIIDQDFEVVNQAIKEINKEFNQNINFNQKNNNLQNNSGGQRALFFNVWQ